ncbi:hypothetical protein [Rhodovibrio sodomensis]|nr:hypothetical protein [Rhodovibrio sodomensis]
MPINVRSDQPHGDRLERQLVGLRGERRTQFLHTLQRMNDNRIPAADCAEVLNARYETYPINLGDGGLVLLADLNSANGGWTLLDIVMVGTPDNVTLKQGRSLAIPEVAPADVPVRLYDACCTAHGLTAPARERHGDRRR